MTESTDQRRDDWACGMSAQVHAFDWSTTELGAIATWPTSLATLVDTMLGLPCPMMLWWGAGATQIYNDAAIPLLGERHPGALGDSARQSWAAAWDRLGPVVERVYANRCTTEVQLPVDGVAAATTLAVVPVPDGRGGVGGVMVTVGPHEAEQMRRRELTIEQAARRAAERTCQRLRAIFMQAPAPIAVLLGPDYIVEVSNPAMSRVWGRPPGQAWGKPALGLVPEASPLIKPMLDRVYATGEPYVAKDFPYRGIQRPDGGLEQRYGDFVVAPLRDEAQRVHGLVLIAVDTTDEIRVRTEMHRLRAEAESASRAKDEFLAMLGHELRNPLSPITTALQIMRMQGKSGRELDVLERQVGHLTRLVDDLLDVSRAMRGKIELHRRDIELATVIKDAIELAGPLLEQRRNVVDVDVQAQGLCVHADPTRLVQAVSNLLTNASKYSDPESHITVRATHTDHMIRLSVRDRGIGMSPETLDRIFDPFVQQPQTIERAAGGLGLGLPIVRSLIELHGGRVSATSPGLGGGSEFTIELPALDHLVVPVPRPSAPVDAREVAHRHRVLVVDDNEDAAVTLSEALETLGYEIEVAHDGPSALRIAEQFHPEVALLDIGLPVMDGYELAERLRAQGGSCPHLVALTGYGQAADREHSARVGFERHLVKPINLVVLSKVIAQLAEGPGA